MFKEVRLKFGPKETIVINGVPLKNPSRHKVVLLAYLPDGMQIVRQVTGRPRIRLDIELPEGG